MTREEFLHNIKGILQYHESIGVEYDKSDDLQQFLDTECEEVLEPAIEQPKLVANQTSSVVAKTTSEPVVVDLSSKSLEKTDFEKNLCDGCKLKAKQLHFVEGKKKETARLMVVGDWLKQSATGGGKTAVFGVEQDMMLARMFSKMQLPEEDVFVTNIVKCALPDDTTVVKEDISRCVKFLHYQIEQLQPEVICVMGTSAAQTVLGKPISLSQLRGKFYQIEFANGFIVPVLATYHPTYLLNNKEMRWPAWEDLQRVAGRLGIKLAS